jgi:hypothetical protein
MTSAAFDAMLRWFAPRLDATGSRFGGATGGLSASASLVGRPGTGGQAASGTQVVVALGAMLLGLLLATAAGATQTDTRGLHAVPAPGPVTIDGKLDDWDLSGATLMCYDLENLRDVYSASVALMYDADRLYLSLHWKDPRPMSNSHDPHYQASKGWAGDCVQLRLKTDRISHITAWYWAKGHEPAIQIDYGKSLTEPFGGGSKVLYAKGGWKLDEGAEMAFLADADGHGYVQEIALPWALITNKVQYKAGDSFRCGFELLWGDADWPVHRYADNLAEGAASREFFWTAHTAWGSVTLEPSGHLTLPEPAWVKQLAPEPPRGPIGLTYTLPKDSLVTIAIDDADGKRVRNLLAYVPRSAGEHTELWDGQNDDGKVVPAGDYRYKLLYHDPLRASYVMSFANPGHPSWETSDGRGAWYSDHANPQAAAAAGDFVALGCPMAEAGRHLIACTLDGQRVWGLANRAAFDGGRISLATDGTTLWIGNDAAATTVWRCELASGKYSPWQRKATDSSGREYQVLDLEVAPPRTKDQPFNLCGLAVQKGVLALALRRDNAIALRSASTGDEIKTLAVEAPRAVAFEPDGGLLTLAAPGLVRLKDGQSTVLAVDFDVAQAVGLAVDAQGRIYVSVRGSWQNVQVLDPAGHRLSEIGSRGGRPANGPYDRAAMLNPAGLAVDAKGRLWVTEENDNPKRTSVWSTADGQLVQDLPGCLHYASAAAINPFDPTMAVADNTIWRIDLGSGAWRPVWSLAQRDDPADLFPPRVDSHARFVVHEGRTYVYHCHRDGEVSCCLWDGRNWRACASVGTVREKLDTESPVNYLSPLLKDHVGEIYAWADRNGDGLVQPDELTFRKPGVGLPPLQNHYWGELPDENGAIPYFNAQAQCLIELPIVGWTACGAPLYDPRTAQVIPTDRKILAGGEGMAMGGGLGRVYVNQSPLLALDASGKVLWTYPSAHVSVHGSHTAAAARPGYLIGPSSILGTADFGGSLGEVFMLNGNLGENYVFTHDGLFVQALFKDTRGWFETPSEARRGESFDLTTAGGESFGGQFFRSPDGHAYLVQGGTDARVLELTGWDSAHRADGGLTVTPAQVLEAQQLAQELAAGTAAPKTLTIAKAAAPPAIDGKVDSWPELLDDNRALAEIRENGHRYARVAARWDAEQLYLAWRVFSPNPAPRNAGQDWRLLFKSGDGVDLMIGAPDQRLLLTVFEGQLLAVLNRKSAPGAAAGDRFGFASPARTIWFDRVVRAPEVRAAVGPLRDGWLLTAAVPWKLLDITPQSGLKLRGDFGALFADAAGRVTIARQYWSNRATGLVNDIPGEADLTPAAWGTLTLE